MSLVWSRESKALVLVVSFHYLTRPQLEELLFNALPVRHGSNEVITRRILRRLVQGGLVATRARVVGGARGGSACLVYYPTAKGHQAIRPLCPGLPPRRAGSGREFLLRHSLAGAEVALAFQRAARIYPDHELITWECDWQAAERLGPGAVVPDAHLLYETADYELEAFIEVDLGTERTRFFQRKIARYLALYRSGSWRARFASWPLVLVITPDDARTTVLKEATEALLGAQPDATRLASRTEFRFSALPHILGPAGPLREIWQIAGRNGTHVLLEESLEDASALIEATAPSGPVRTRARESPLRGLPSPEQTRMPA